MVKYVIFVGVYISKYLSHKTDTVDVLWFIIIGAILGNFHLIEESHSLEFLGDIGIILVMFALGFEEDARAFVDGVKKSWGNSFDRSNFSIYCRLL